MGNGVSAPQGGAGPGAPASAPHGSPFISSTVLSSSPPRRRPPSVLLPASSEAQGSGVLTSRTACYAGAETLPLTPPKQHQRALKALPPPLPLPPSLANPALPPPPSSTRSEPPYRSPWPPSSPDSLSPCSSGPVQPPYRRACGSSAFRIAAPESTHSGTTLVPESGLHALNESDLGDSSRLAACPDMAYGVLSSEGVKTMREADSPAAVLVGTVSTERQADGHHLLCPSFEPIENEDMIERCLVPGLSAGVSSREALAGSAARSRTFEQGKLGMMGPGARHRSLSDDETCAVGSSGTALCLPSASPPMGAADRKRKGAVPLRDHSSFLPPSDNGTLLSSPDVAGVPLVPSMSGSGPAGLRIGEGIGPLEPREEPREVMSHGGGEAGESSSESVNVATSLREIASRGLLGGKCVDMAGGTGSLVPGDDGAPGRNIVVLTVDGGMSAHRDLADGEPRQPHPFAWPSGGTGSLRGRGSCARSSRGRGRSATAASCTSVPKSLSRGGVLEGSLAFGVTQPSRKERGFFLPSFSSTANLARVSGEHAVDSNAPRHCCPQVASESSPHALSFPGVNSCSCCGRGQVNSAVSPAFHFRACAHAPGGTPCSPCSDGAEQNVPSLRRGRSCLGESASARSPSDTAVYVAAPPAGGDIQGDERGDSLDSATHASAVLATDKDKEKASPAFCHNCCSRGCLAPASVSALTLSALPPQSRPASIKGAGGAAGTAYTRGRTQCCPSHASDHCPSFVGTAECLSSGGGNTSGFSGHTTSAAAVSPSSSLAESCAYSHLQISAAGASAGGGTRLLANSMAVYEARRAAAGCVHLRSKGAAVGMVQDVAVFCQEARCVPLKVTAECRAAEDFCQKRPGNSLRPGGRGERGLSASSSQDEVNLVSDRSESGELAEDQPIGDWTCGTAKKAHTAGGLSCGADAGSENLDRSYELNRGGRHGTPKRVKASGSAAGADAATEGDQNSCCQGATSERAATYGGEGSGNATGLPQLCNGENGVVALRAPGGTVTGNVSSTRSSSLSALSGDSSAHFSSCVVAKRPPAPGGVSLGLGGSLALSSSSLSVSSVSGLPAGAAGGPPVMNNATTSAGASSGVPPFSHSPPAGSSGTGGSGGLCSGQGKGGSGGSGGKKGGAGGGGSNGGGGGGGGGGNPYPASSRGRAGGNKECQSVDFYVRSFWKVAKTQNDLESPTQGYCRGFVYRLLLHPRGTTGTDSEASHLSVFLEAIRQDWYPDDWIFPNVRFELTVVNFKDPKQSVTSWAHWSFSNEATSRGWQKMISHARLNKQSGFMDEDGTVLVRGKAEPPFASLWSRGPVYRPHRIWEYIPERAAKALEDVSSSCSAAAAALTAGSGSSASSQACGTQSATLAVAGNPSNGATGATLPRLKTPTASLLSYVDPIVPTLDSSLGADYVALFVHCLFHLCEFRKHIYMWKSDFIKAPTAEQLAQDPSLAAQIPSFADGSLIGALQQTFAYMQLWPVTVACRRLQHLAASSSSTRKEICPSEIWKWYGAELFPKNSPSRGSPPPPLSSSSSRLAFCTLCKRCTCCCRCKTTAYHATASSPSFLQSGMTGSPPSEGAGRRGDEDEARSFRRVSSGSSEDPDLLLKQLKLDRDTCLCCDLLDRYPEAMSDMPPQPNIKAVLKALHMHDVQKMDVPDPLVKVHTELFSLLMRELAKAKLEAHHAHEYQARAVAAAAAAAAATAPFSAFASNRGEQDAPEGVPPAANTGPAAAVWTDVDGVAFTSCDHLEATCHELFSSSDRSTGLLNADGVPDISAGFTRCKHVHSLQKALESCGKVLQHFPEVLFVYLQSVKQCKKGELFDAPLRLDAHKLLQVHQPRNAAGKGNAEGSQKGAGGGAERGAGGGTGVVDREKQRRRLRKKLQQSRKGNKMSRDAPEEESDITEDEELAISDDDEVGSTQGGYGDSDKGVQGKTSDSAKNASSAQMPPTAGQGAHAQGGVGGAVPGGAASSAATSNGGSSGSIGNQEKWFSLFALFIREGDSRGDGCGAQTSHYLLLRPEEDGPWFRIGDGRVERLSSKVDFTEWKCHRDFFCAGAVYIAEDYIDAVQAGDVDLSGDLRELNPWLYYRTLYELGVTEAEIKRPWITLQSSADEGQAATTSSCASSSPLPCGSGGGLSVGETPAFFPLGGDAAAAAAGEASEKREDSDAAHLSAESGPASDIADSKAAGSSGFAQSAWLGEMGGASAGAVMASQRGSAAARGCPPSSIVRAPLAPGSSETEESLFYACFESGWRPQTPAEERRYTVLAPVAKWIFEVAIEKAVIFSDNSPEIVENHYWFVLRMQYLEKILLLELRHAICEVLYDEWLANFVTPFLSASQQSALAEAEAQADDGGAAAAAPASVVMPAGTQRADACDDAASSKATGGKGGEKKRKKGGAGGKAEQTAEKPGSASPPRVAHREAAEVIARWTRTHLSDNGRLLVDEMGTLLKDPLHRLVDKICTLRHEVEILCREGRGRSLLYRVSNGPVSPGSSDPCAPAQPASAGKAEPGEAPLPAAGAAWTGGSAEESDHRGQQAPKEEESAASAELRQAVTERLTDLWACCRVCVEESAEILARYTVERFGAGSWQAGDTAGRSVRNPGGAEAREEEASGLAQQADTTRREGDGKESGFQGRGSSSADASGKTSSSSQAPASPCYASEAAVASPPYPSAALPGGAQGTGGALDHLGQEYDLPIDETVELLAFLAEAFCLPDFRTMRRFLRDRRHLVFERVRPHELIRAYLSLSRPEVHLPAFLEENGYNVKWCEAAFQPEDVSAIWGDASVPDVAAVQSVSRGFQLPRAVSSVLLRLLVTALDCGPGGVEGAAPARGQESETASAEAAEKRFSRTSKAKKPAALQKERFLTAASSASGGSAPSATQPGSHESPQAETKGSRSTEERGGAADLRGDENIRHSVAEDVAIIVRAMEHDCPELASPAPLQPPVDSHADSSAETAAGVSPPGLAAGSSSLSPAEALVACGVPQGVPAREMQEEYASPLAMVPKIPLTLPLAPASEKGLASQGAAGKLGRKKGRGGESGGGSSSSPADPTQVVPVLDRILPRLNFEQRVAAAADPGVFLLCPAATSSTLSSFASSPRVSRSLASPTGAGGAATPSCGEPLATSALASKPGLATASCFPASSAPVSSPHGVASAAALERELLGLGDSGVAAFSPCIPGAARGVNGGGGNASAANNACRRLRYHGLEVGLLLAEDLKGLEGFSIEDSLPIRARLLVRKNVAAPGPPPAAIAAGSAAPTPPTPPASSPSSSPSPSSGASAAPNAVAAAGSAVSAATQTPPAVSEPLTVQRLYWAFRRLLHAQIEERDVSADGTASASSSAVKGKGKNPTTAKAYEQQLTLLNQQSERELWWLPTARDAFLLYALRPDPDPTRKGRRRFVYMDPLDELEMYTDSKRQLVDSSAPDITLLFIAAPQRCCTEASAWLKGSAFSSTVANAASSAAAGIVLPPPALTFPLEDAEEFPLLVFKWFSADSVDLFCVGALVCDAKQQLQTYILDWLVPQVRARGYLSPLSTSTIKDDADNFLVLEECHLRTVQNIRRWSCAIRKINKRGGDVIIVQKKGLIESPASIRYRESSALLEKVRLYEVSHQHHYAEAGGAAGEFDLGEGLGTAALPPLASTVSGAAGSGDFLLEGNPDLLPLLQDGAAAGGTGDRERGLLYGSQPLDEGDEDGGAGGGGGKKKKKKQKRVLPRAAIPSNKKSVIARLAEDQRREETTLLKAAAKDNEKEISISQEDLGAVQSSVSTTTVGEAPSVASGSSASADKGGKKKGKAAAAGDGGVSEEEEEPAASTAKSVKKSSSKEAAKEDRLKLAEGALSDKGASATRKSGGGGAVTASTAAGKSSSASGTTKDAGEGAAAKSAGGKQKGKTEPAAAAGGKSASASSSAKAKGSEEKAAEGTGPSSRTDGVGSRSAPSAASPAKEDAAASDAASAPRQKKGKTTSTGPVSAGAGKAASTERAAGSRPAASGEDRAEERRGEAASVETGGAASPSSALLGSASASSPPLSPASSTLSRGSSFSLVTLPVAVQGRLSPAAQQLLQKISDKQHVVSPALLREAAATLLDEFLSRISQIYQDAVAGEALERRGAGETAGTAEKKERTAAGSPVCERGGATADGAAAGGAGGAGGHLAASASWATLVGAGVGSVAVDEISECAEALETICSSCLSTQQRPIFIKEVQLLLEQELQGRSEKEDSLGEARSAAAGDAAGATNQKDAVGEKGGKSTGAVGAAKARKGNFYSGVAAGKVSSAAQEASASDARLAAFHRLFASRRRAAFELFVLLSVTRGGQLVTRKLVAQYCLAALDRDPASDAAGASASALLGTASVILMWLFLGPRLICKLGDSQQGRRFIDGGLRKIFDFFQQRTALCLQLQQSFPPSSSLLASPTAALSATLNTGGAAPLGGLHPLGWAQPRADPAALVAWAAGVLLKVFHLSRASQLALPRQADALTALQHIQLPSAFATFFSKAGTAASSASPASVWGAGGAGLLATAGAAGSASAAGEASSAGLAGDGQDALTGAGGREGGKQLPSPAARGGGALLLPPLSAATAPGGAAASTSAPGWGGVSALAESVQGGLPEDGAKRTASQRGGQVQGQGLEATVFSPLAASKAAGASEGSTGAETAPAAGSGRAGALKGTTKGTPAAAAQAAKGSGVMGASPGSPSAAVGPSKLVVAIDEREDSEDDEDNVDAYREEGEEETCADLPSSHDDELLVGEQSLYGSGKALSRRVFKKAAPYVVEEGVTWMVLYKPAFWHCSGFGRDRPVFIPRVVTPQELEEALAHISLEDLISSGKIESFHLYMMKKYPRLETVRRWEEMECGLCHRTDLETSGSLLIAKNRRARESIFEQFRKRLVHKEYLLLCHGRLDKLYARIDHPIATRDFDSNRSKSHFSEVVGPDEGGDEALTEYQVVRVFSLRQPLHRKIQTAMSVAARIAASPSSSSSSATAERTRGNGASGTSSAASAKAAGSGKGSPVSNAAAAANKKDFTYSQEFSFCRVRIHTGRTHQIRVHFRHIGHPLVGDTKYCDVYKCTVDRSWCARMFLHSAVLEFDNPDKAESQHVRVVCPLATELLAALENELVCSEDYSQITTDMLDRSGQVKPEYRHLVIHDPAGPPAGSVPGYTALPTPASSSPSSASRPCVLPTPSAAASSPPLLPLGPCAALNAEGRHAPASPASSPLGKQADARAPILGSAAVASAQKTSPLPPASKSSPVVLSSEKPQAAREMAPVTLPGRAPEAGADSDRGASGGDERTRDETSPSHAGEKKLVRSVSASDQPPLLPVQPPSPAKDLPSSALPSSADQEAVLPPADAAAASVFASRFSGIFDSLLEAVSRGEGRRDGRARGEADEGLEQSSGAEKAPTGRGAGDSRRRYIEEADWSFGDMHRAEERGETGEAGIIGSEREGRTGRERGEWSYREFANDLADLMRLPPREKDVSGLRRLTDAVATAPPFPSVREEEEGRQCWNSVHAAQRSVFHRTRERLLEAAFQSLMRLLHFSELHRDVVLPSPPVEERMDQRPVISSASSSITRQCRCAAFDSRSAQLIDREGGPLLIPSFSEVASGASARGGGHEPLTPVVASLNSVPSWKSLLEMLAAHYPACLFVTWDADMQAVLVVLLSESPAELKKISQAAAAQGQEQQAAARVKAFVDFLGAFKDLSKFECASPALARAVGNAPLARGPWGSSRHGDEKRGSAQGKACGGSKEGLVVVGPGRGGRRTMAGARPDDSSASLWRMQEWRKVADGSEALPVCAERGFEGQRAIRLRLPIGDVLPPFRDQMGIMRTPAQASVCQPPLLPSHSLYPAHAPGVFPPAHPSHAEFHSSPGGRAQPPLLPSGGLGGPTRLQQDLPGQDRQFLLSQHSGGASGGGAYPFLPSPLPSSLSDSIPSGHDSASGRFDGSQRGLSRLPGTALGPDPLGALGSRASWAPSVWGSPGAGGSASCSAAAADGSAGRGLGRAESDGAGDRRGGSLRRGQGDGGPPHVPFVFLWGADGAAQADATPRNSAEVQEEDIRDLMDLSFMMGSTPVSGHTQAVVGSGSTGPLPDAGERRGGGLSAFHSPSGDSSRGDASGLQKLHGGPAASGEESSERRGTGGAGLGRLPQQGQDEGPLLLRDVPRRGEVEGADGARRFPQEQALASGEAFMPRLPHGEPCGPASQGASSSAGLSLMREQSAAAPPSSQHGSHLASQGLLPSSPGSLPGASSAPLLPFGQPPAGPSTHGAAGSSTSPLLLTMGPQGAGGGRGLRSAGGEAGGSSSASSSLGTRRAGQSAGHQEGALALEAARERGENQVFVNGKWCVRVEIPHPPAEAPPHPSIMFLHQQVSRDMQSDLAGGEDRRGRDEGDESGSALTARAAAALLSRRYCDGAASVLTESALHDQLNQQRRATGGAGELWPSSNMGVLGCHSGAATEGPAVDSGLLLLDSRRNSGAGAVGRSTDAGVSSIQQAGPGGNGGAASVRSLGPVGPAPRPSPSPPGNMPVPPAHIHPSLRSHLAATTSRVGFPLPEGAASFGSGRVSKGLMPSEVLPHHAGGAGSAGPSLVAGLGGGGNSLSPHSSAAGVRSMHLGLGGVSEFQAQRRSSDDPTDSGSVCHFASSGFCGVTGGGVAAGLAAAGAAGVSGGESRGNLRGPLGSQPRQDPRLSTALDVSSAPASQQPLQPTPRPSESLLGAGGLPLLPPVAQAGGAKLSAGVAGDPRRRASGDNAGMGCGDV
ncbi:hypothetical protein BESB_018670 [Besnoitia besnoiti]|uniref:MATH domain-containing protein n=1 Tax=Besnoitia besnoiti TaxID=94643 RepID=A0A2A9M3N3_BESBE|nr:hypothetical protein BESB_018670 [Besnoitia besnoiti]PFH32549.1 hypothetical protein BESB_018670 [Besnoitia besnoiti]